MRDKGTLPNIDNSDPVKYPNGRIKNNTGGGNGTPVNEEVYGDLHEAKDKLLRLYGILPNGLPDNETNGYQLIDGLIALATKNDFTLTLNESLGQLTVPLKLSKLKDNETFILKASVDKTTETTIKGTLDGSSKTIVFLGDFKANEYVRMINTPGTVILVRMIDSFNLQAAVEELGFLKKALQAEEDAGTTDLVATTPLVNKTTFTKRVIGDQSDNYLATDLQNGLISAELVEKLEAIPPNVLPFLAMGGFGGLDIGGTVGPLTVKGNFQTATASVIGPGVSQVVVTFINDIGTGEYIPLFSIFESGLSGGLSVPVISKIAQTSTGFTFKIGESATVTQDIDLNFIIIESTFVI